MNSETVYAIPGKSSMEIGDPGGDYDAYCAGGDPWREELDREETEADHWYDDREDDDD